ncbi:MAG: carboxypeptidase-like regulatory domain-containing protein [Bacteroidia bacterium]
MNLLYSPPVNYYFKRIFCAVITTLTLAITGIYAQSAFGEIRGNVYDKENGEPVISAIIFIRELKLGKQTDLNGFYALTRIKPGTYELTCYYTGYDTARVTIMISEGKITTQKIFMIRKTHQLNEVSISAEKQKAQTETRVSNITITQRELKQLPSFGGEPDLAQYLQILPGVVFSGDQGGQLYMRGGPPVQNKILLDGMTIYNPFHSIGLFSVFDADIIRSADVFAGGFNAQYGGRIGSIIDVSTREGNKVRFSGKVNTNPISSKILFEGPISKFKEGSSASFIVSYKTSYLDQTSKILYPYAGTNGLPFSFNDIYSKISLLSDNGSKVSFFGFGFFDNVNYANTNQFDWKSIGGGSNFFLVTSGSTVINGTVAYSDYFMEQVEGDGNTLNSDIHGFNIGLNFTSFIGKDDLKYGFEMNGFNTNFNFVNAYNFQIQQAQSNTELCGYFKYKTVIGRFLFEPGIRIQDYASVGEVTFEPRFSMKYNLSDKIRLKGAAGYYTQNLMSTTSNQDVVNFFYGFLSSPNSSVSNAKLGIDGSSKLQKAIHYVGGVEADIGQHGSINIEGFYKNFLQIPELNNNKLTASDPDFIFENGKAFGGDILYRYDYKHLYIWLVYSLTYVDLSDGNSNYVPSYDRRHNANAVATYSLGKNESWSFNARWNFGSGFPFTPTQGLFENPNYSAGASTNNTTQNGTLGVYYGAYNSQRLPYFHRMDVSISKKIKLGKNTSMMIVAACTNIYNRNNVFYFDRLNMTRVDQLPVMPTLGVNFSF